MNILYISHLVPTEQNPSFGIFMKRYVDMVRATGTKVDVLVPTVHSIPFTDKWGSNHSPIKIEGASRVKYLSIPRRKAPTIVKKNISRSLCKIVNQLNPDIIHVNWVYPDSLAIPALKKFNKPIIMHIHGADWYENFNNPKMKVLVEESVKASNQIWVVGSSLKTDIETSIDEIEGKIYVVPNSIDTLGFFIAPDKQALRKELGWKDGINLLTVAHFRREKGHLDLLEAIEKINPKQLVRLHMVGAKYDQAYYSEVEKKAAKIDHVKIELYDAISPAELPKVMAAADIFVLPSKIEGFGVALIEAGASGLPIVATKCGGPEDIVTSEIGLLAKPSDSASIAESVTKMLNNYKKYNPEKIRKSIQQRYDTSVLQGLIIDRYDRMLK
jgi:glycosyltransferase involved in cell wall biosynthesis